MRWPCGLCDEEYESAGSIERHRHVNGFCFTVSSYDETLRVPRHSHDSASFTVVLSGAYQERAIGVPGEVEAGTVIFKSAGEPHANRYRARTTTLLVQFRNGTPDLEQLQLPALRETFAVRAPAVAAIGRELMFELTGDDDGSALECGVFELLSRAADGHIGRTPAPRVVAVVRNWLHSCYHEPLDLCALAHIADVTPSYLARAFRAATGRTIGQYQRHLRVTEVVQRLSRTDATIADIAHQAGFTDQSHCTRVFRRHFGVAPGAFRAARRRARDRFPAPARVGGACESPRT